MDSRTKVFGVELPVAIQCEAPVIAICPPSLVVLRGEVRHKDLWLIDLKTGEEHPLTYLAPDFDVRDLDISPDGHDIVLEHAQEHSDIVLLEVPRR